MLAWKKEEEYVDAVLAYDDSVYCVFLDPDLTSVKDSIVFQLNFYLDLEKKDKAAGLLARVDVHF